jgi:hypothetical protein
VYNKDKTTLVIYPSGKKGAFTIPDSVTSIKKGAFENCVGLTNITISEKVSGIEEATFQGCTSLTRITIGKNTYPYDVFISQLRKANKEDESDNSYDPSKFTVIPSGFNPSKYRYVDLFRAASDSKNLKVVANKQEAIFSWGGNYYLEYVSDLTFVRQNGTDITFSSDDNAITQLMSISQRSGLQAGQKVRVYYMVTRSPLPTWDVIAIERR